MKKSQPTPPSSRRIEVSKDAAITLGMPNKTLENLTRFTGITLQVVGSLLLGAFAVTACVVLAFFISDWLKTPEFLVPLFFFPAAVVFAWYNKSKFDWHKTLLFLLVAGVFLDLPAKLLPDLESGKGSFWGMILFVLVSPALERLYERIRSRLRH